MLGISKINRKSKRFLQMQWFTFAQVIHKMSLSFFYPMQDIPFLQKVPLLLRGEVLCNAQNWYALIGIQLMKVNDESIYSCKTITLTTGFFGWFYRGSSPPKGQFFCQILEWFWPNLWAIFWYIFTVNSVKIKQKNNKKWHFFCLKGKVC